MDMVIDKESGISEVTLGVSGLLSMSVLWLCITPLCGATGDNGPPDMSMARLGLISGGLSRPCSPGGRGFRDI